MTVDFRGHREGGGSDTAKKRTHFWHMTLGGLGRKKGVYTGVGDQRGRRSCRGVEGSVDSRHVNPQKESHGLGGFWERGRGRPNHHGVGRGRGQP